jgi:hypothetical protein
LPSPSEQHDSKIAGVAEIAGVVEMAGVVGVVEMAGVVEIADIVVTVLETLLSTKGSSIG